MPVNVSRSVPAKASTRNCLFRLIGKNPRDVLFSVAVTISNTVGYLLIVIPPLLLDPVLTKHLGHPLGVRFNWPWTIPFIAVGLAATTLLLTYCLGRQLITAAGSLLIAFALTFPVFPYEMPHSGIFGMGTVWIGVTIGWVLIRYFLFPSESVNPRYQEAAKEARIEFVKQQLDFAKLLFLGLLAAYLGLIVTWFQEIHEFNRRLIDNDQYQVYLLDCNFLLQAAITALFYLLGPLLEVAKQRHKLLVHCLDITVRGAQPEVT